VNVTLFVPEASQVSYIFDFGAHYSTICRWAKCSAVLHSDVLDKFLIFYSGIGIHM
jgi:hypothetical protein